ATPANSGSAAMGSGTGFDRCVAYSARPVNTVPAMMFPMVTGIWFHIHHAPNETGAFSSMPAGIQNKLKIKFSKPWAKKVKMGSHIATILPIVDRDTMANKAPTVTIQLHSTAFTKAVAQPAPPAAM